MSKTFKSLAAKILKITSLSVVGILLILFLLPIVFPGKIEESIKRFANKSLDGELNFSKARLSFFSHFPSLTLSLSDFTLKGSAPFKGDTLFATKKIGFGINLQSLVFNKRIDIDKIFIDEANIKVQVNKNGEANYNVYVPAKKNKTINKADTAGTALKLEKIVISNSHVVYDDESVSILLNAKGFNYTGNGDLSKAIFDLNSHAEIDSLDFYFEDQPYLENKKIDGNLVTRINTSSFAFLFQKDNLLINKLPVEFNGKLNFLQNGYDIDFEVKAVKTDLDNLVTALPPQFITWEQKTKIKGVTDLLLTLKGKYISSLNAMPNLAFNMQIRDGYIAYEGAPFPITNLFLNLDTKMPSVNPDSLQVKVDSIFFKLDDNFLSAVINTLGVTKPFINAKVTSQMDLAKLNKALGLSTIELKGTCDLHLTMNGKYASKTDSARHETRILSIPSFDLKATLKEGYFKYDSMPVAVKNISLNVNSSCADSNYQHAGFDISNISANALTSFIKGNVSLNNLHEMFVNADLKAVVNLADLKNIYPVKGAAFAGLLKLNIDAKGRYDAVNKTFPVTKADMTLQNGIIKTKYYPHPVSDIQFSAKVSNSTGTLKGMIMEIQPASFKFEGEPFNFRASLKNFNDINYDVKANGKINIARIYKVFARKGEDLTGFIKADLSLQGKQSDATSGHYNKLNNHGTLAISNIEASSDNFPKPFFIKEGLFKFEQEKMWFNKFLASYGHSDFALDGYLQDVIGYAISKNASLKGNFKMHAKLLDADEFMAFAPAQSPAKGSAAKETSTLSKSSTGVIIVPSDLNVSLNATADKVRYNGLNLDSAAANIAINKAQIVLSKTGFGMIGCRVLMDALYGSIGTRKAFFESHLKADDFDIKRAYNEVPLFHDMATAAANAEGIISIDYNLKGILDENMKPVYPSLEGGGVVSVRSVKMKGFKLLSSVGDKTGKDGIKDPELSKINIKSTIKNNVINIEQFKIKSSGFRLRIEGKTNFDGAIEMKMRLGLPPFGIIGIPMHVTGTQEKPVIKLGKGDKDESVKETQVEEPKHKKR